MGKYLAACGMLFIGIMPLSAQAGVAVFSGNAGEQLLIESAPDLGDEVYLVKFSGLKSPWENKVILTRKKTVAGLERFSFDYVRELSSGKQKRSYTLIAEISKSFVKGSVVRRMELSYGNGKTVVLAENSDLAKTLQNSNLIADHKKAPFVPVVD